MLLVGAKYILFFVVLVSFFTLKQEDIVEHKVVVNHPAFEKEDETSFILKEKIITKDSSEYFLEVASVICVDHLCKIVPVKLFWNTYGEYLRYELEDHIQLEKGEGEPFTETDYKLLHQILKDSSSPYKDISYYEITHERVIGESQVDAISGATEVVLATGETVVGGAWTCFTLWHWANGEIVQEIKRVSGDKLNKRQILENLNADAERYKIYAINELANRKLFDVEFIELLMKYSPHATKEINKRIINYLEQAPDSLYFELIGNFYQNVQPEYRMLYLNSLLGTNKEGSAQDYEVYLSNISSVTSYQEINILLEIFDYQQLTVNQLNQIMQLLNNDNFLISRRAFWFMKSKEQTEDVKKRLSVYMSKNKARL